MGVNGDYLGLFFFNCTHVLLCSMLLFWQHLCCAAAELDHFFCAVHQVDAMYRSWVRIC